MEKITKQFFRHKFLIYNHRPSSATDENNSVADEKCKSEGPLVSHRLPCIRGSETPLLRTLLGVPTLWGPALRALTDCFPEPTSIFDLRLTAGELGRNHLIRIPDLT